MATATQTQKTTEQKTQMGGFFGKLYSFNTSLKLYHWHVTGQGSYAEHIALDQAIETVSDVLDRLVETSYSVNGTIDIVIPETPVPRNIEEHCQQCFDQIEKARDMFEESFISAILDDYQEGIQQLLYRLRRLR